MENWYDKDAVWTDARARRSVSKKSNAVMRRFQTKLYVFYICFGSRKNLARLVRRKLSI